MTPTEPLSKSLFVGREPEIAALRAGVEDAMTGRGRCVLLSGEPGIGKTRTCEELATYASGRGAHVLWGRCYEGPGAPAFWPWVQLLRTAIRPFDTAALEQILGSRGPDIAQLVPEVRERLPDLAHRAVGDFPEARFRLFDAVTGLLERLADRAPLVIVLDDLHGGDPPSLQLLQFVARQIRHMPLLLLGAYRNTAVNREHHPLAETFAEVLRDPDTPQVVLSGLMESEVAQLIALNIGVQPPPALVAALHKQTAGNPLFVREYLRFLRTDKKLNHLNDTAQWNLGVPDSLRTMIRQHLAPLSAECRHALVIAAIIGRNFDLAVVERVWRHGPTQLLEHDSAPVVGRNEGATDQESGPTQTVNLLDVLREAVDVGLITQTAAAPAHFSFVHFLIRETLYDDLRPSVRVGLHRMVGEAIEHLKHLNRDSRIAAMAYHFSEAAAGSDLEDAIHCFRKATLYSMKAGEEATQRLAWEEATAHYERALKTIDLRGSSLASEVERCELLLCLGDSRQRGGGRESTRQAFEQAATIAEGLQASGETRAAGLLARATLGIGYNIEFGKTDPLLVRLCRLSLAALGNEDSAARARVLALTAVALTWSDTLDRRAALVHEAVRMARRLDDKWLLAFVLAAQNYSTWNPDDLDERLAAATELRRVAREVGDQVWTMRGCYYRVAYLLELGDIVAADAQLEEFSRLARDLRQPVHLAMVAHQRVTRALMDGRLADAETLAMEAVTLGQHAQNPNAASAFALQMFFLRKEQGRLDELEPIIESFVRSGGSTPALRCFLAHLHAELGHASTARSEWEELAQDDFSNIPRDNRWLSTIAVASDVAAFLGDAPRAAVLYDILRPYAARLVCVPVGFACFGSVAHFLGLLARTTARWDDAIGHFEDALATHIRISAAGLVTRTQYEYARMLRRRGLSTDRERTDDLFTQGLATAQALDLQSLATKLLALQTTAQPPITAREDAGRSVARPTPQTQQLTSRDLPPEMCLFSRTGGVRTITFGGTTCQLKDSRGLQYVAYLLRHASQEIHVLDLVQRAGSGAPGSAVETEEPGTTRKRGLGVRDRGLPQLDAQAKAEYRTRLHELQAALEEAEGFNDRGAAERARAEIEVLSEQLTAAVGAGGRDRPVGAAAERARVAVSKRIKEALGKIRAVHAPLAEHLTASLTTGYFCAYVPMGSTPTWHV